MEMCHGKIVVRIGGRLFAVRKDVGLVDRIAQSSQTRGAWERQMTIPKPRIRNTRCIKA